MCSDFTLLLLIVGALTHMHVGAFKREGNDIRIYNATFDYLEHLKRDRSEPWGTRTDDFVFVLAVLVLVPLW